MILFKEHKPLKDYDSVSLAELIRVFSTENFPVAVTTKIGEAVQVASYLHRYDVRRGGRGKNVSPPYIEHPLRVAIRCFKYFGVEDPNAIIAAILHDTVEDHAEDFDAFEGVSIPSGSSPELARERALEFVAQHFGYRVARIVEQLSNPIPPEGQTKAEKLESYHHKMEKLFNSDEEEEALVVKASDFVDNAGSLHHHYAYDDAKVIYFVDRYEPLIPLYVKAFSRPAKIYDADAVLARINKVAAEFAKFRAGTKK